MKMFLKLVSQDEFAIWEIREIGFKYSGGNAVYKNNMGSSEISWESVISEVNTRRLRNYNIDILTEEEAILELI